MHIPDFMLGALFGAALAVSALVVLVAACIVFAGADADRRLGR